MTTGAGVKVVVDLLQKEITYTVNILLQMAYRIESGRGLSGEGYMSRTHEIIERGFRTWVTEQKLQSVHFEIYDPQSDKAYEVGNVYLTYIADPVEQVVKPPIEQLESLFTKLKKLPPGAQFRVVVHNAPGYSEVPGWYLTTLKDLMGGVAEEIEVGDEKHGFGRMWGKVVYTIGNWGGKQQDQHKGANT
jgi:hypothetical protein